jgi:N-acetylglutamate synthase-like GNAT family acetyltransferase
VRGKPSVEQLASFYADAGWVKNPELLDLQKSIDNTSLWILAREGKDVVGLARLQTDYVRYCCIYDLIVRSDRRGSGLGTRIMEEAMAFCDSTGIRIAHLWPMKGTAGFYERLGFKPLDSEQPTMVRIGG